MNYQTGYPHLKNVTILVNGNYHQMIDCSSEALKDTITC